MPILATTRASIFRGITVNSLGDPADDNVTVIADPRLASFPISIIERSARVQDPASGIWRTIIYKVGRPTNPSLDIRNGDRLKDLRTGTIYTIDDITVTPRTISGGRTLVLALRINNG